MDLFEALKERRSCRKYTSEPLTRPEIETILEMATWAPSAQNLQPWYFVAVTDPEDLRVIHNAMGSTAFDHRQELETRFPNHPGVVEETLEFMRAFGGAPALFLAFLKKPDYGDQQLQCIESVAAGMTNMCLAAHGLGLGSCWVHGICRAKDVVEERFAPEAGPLIGAIIVGHPAMECKTPRRKLERTEIR